MKKIIAIILLLAFANYTVEAKKSNSKPKGKKSSSKKSTKSKSNNNTSTNTEEYTGPLLKVADTKSETPGYAGFMVDGHYKFTVVETKTPSIHFSGAEQPSVNVCVATPSGFKGSCI